MRPHRSTDPPEGRSGHFIRRILTLAIILAVVIAGVAPTLAAAPGVQTAGNDGDPKPASDGGEYQDAVGPNDTTDTYVFDAAAGEYIRAVTIGGAENVEATLYGPSGDALASHEVYVEHIPLGVRAPESGEYRLVFEELTNYRQEYSFELDIVEPEPTEPNDARDTATALDGDDTVDAVLGEGDDDWYTVSAAAGTTVEADVDRDENIISNHYTVQLYAPDGELLDEVKSYCTPGRDPCDPPAVSATAPEDGEYAVHVAARTIEGFDAYTMTVDATAPQTPTPTPTETADRTDTPEDTPDPTPVPTDEPGTDVPTTEDPASETPAPTETVEETRSPPSGDGGTENEPTVTVTETTTVETRTQTDAESTEAADNGTDVPAGPSAPSVNNSTEGTDAANDTLARDIDDAGSGDGTSSGDGPGFGVVGALVAVGLTLLARYRRG